MTIQLTIDIPEEVHEGLLLLVEREESTLIEVVNEALDLHLLAEDYIDNDFISRGNETWDKLLR